MTVNYEYKNGNVLLRIAHQSRKVRVQSGIKIEPIYWNKEKKIIRSSHYDHKALNAQLSSKKNFIHHLWQNGLKDIDAVKKHIDQHGFKIITDSNTSTCDFIDIIIKTKKQNTARAYRTLALKLRSFDLDRPINTWTKKDLMMFENYLRTEGAAVNYIARLMKDLRSTLNAALMVDMITHDQNPFKLGYKVKKQRTYNVKLELEEVKRLKQLMKRSVAVKVWFVCFYSDGTRISDVLMWKSKDRVNDTITFIESKTGKQKQVSITPSLKRLLDSFNHQGEYILPFLEGKEDHRTEQKRAEAVYAWLNKQLKDAAKSAKINKRLTMHVARNTYSYLALNAGYDITEIQQSLNHSNIQQTRDYIGSLTNDRLADKRNALHGLI